MVFNKKSIQDALQKAKRPELARILSGAWDIPLTEYSTSLWETISEHPSMELELRLCTIWHCLEYLREKLISLDLIQVFLLQTQPGPDV